MLAMVFFSFGCLCLWVGELLLFVAQEGEAGLRHSSLPNQAKPSPAKPRPAPVMYELSLKPLQKRTYFLEAPLRYPISLLHFEYNSLMRHCLLNTKGGARLRDGLVLLNVMQASPKVRFSPI